MYEYVFTELRLTDPEFMNLVFMGTPPWWECEDAYPPCWDKRNEIPEGKDHDFLLGLCYRPLKQVAESVISRSGADRENATATEVFQQIDVVARFEKTSWFASHTKLSQCFEESLMGKLWIRNVADCNKECRERKYSPEGSFYLEDGNHRALVYAVKCLLPNDKTEYKPVKAIHATSWDIAQGGLGYPPQVASVLEHEGKLEYGQRVDKCCVSNSTVADSIQIYINKIERNE